VSPFHSSILKPAKRRLASCAMTSLRNSPNFNLRIFQSQPSCELLSVWLCDVLLELKLPLESLPLEIAEDGSTPRSLSLDARAACVGRLRCRFGVTGVLVRLLIEELRNATIWCSQLVERRQSQDVVVSADVAVRQRVVDVRCHWHLAQIRLKVMRWLIGESCN